MLAETVADTDGQTLGILKYKITIDRPLSHYHVASAAPIIAKHDTK